MRWLKWLLLDHWWLKLLSLGLAYALWLAVAYAPTVDVVLSVPLEFENLSPNLEVASDVPARARLYLRGPQSLLRQVSPEQLGVILDLDGVGAGDHRFPLGSSNVQAPPGIEVVRVVPDTIRLTLVSR